MPKINPEVVKLLDKPVDVRRLVRKLEFSSDQLEDAVLEQPSLHLKAGRLQAQSTLLASMYRRRLARVSSEKFVSISRRGDDSTATAIKSKVSASSKVQSLQKKVDQAEAVYEFAKLLTETFRDRLIVLSIIARLRASETNSELRSVKNEAAISSMRKKAKEARRRYEELEGDYDV